MLLQSYDHDDESFCLTFRALLFPPVNNYRRFLIHKTVEQFSDLKTFSIGEGDARRTVVCFAKQSER
jgi:R3H domain